MYSLMLVYWKVYIKYNSVVFFSCRFTLAGGWDSKLSGEAARSKVLECYIKTSPGSHWEAVSWTVNQFFSM